MIGQIFSKLKMVISDLDNITAELLIRSYLMMPGLGH